MVNESYRYINQSHFFAAILGMYTLMSNKQYYDALGTTGTIANTEGINSTYEEVDQQSRTYLLRYSVYYMFRKFLH